MSASARQTDGQEINMAIVADSLVNFSAGMGVLGKDKRRDSRFKLSGPMGYDELEALYREDWIAGKIIEIIPDDMTRNWRTFVSAELPPDDRKLLLQEEKRLQLPRFFNLAKKWARLYGGCLLVINVDDGKPPDEPLDIDAIRPGDVRNLIVFDRRHAYPQRINLNRPFADNFQRPDTYSLSYSGGQIHHSRTIRFDGVPLPDHLFSRNNYWGDSILKRIRDALVNANISADSSANLLFESNVDVVSVSGLAYMLASDEGTKQLLHRFSTAKYLKSNNNLTLIDKDKEELQKFSNTLAGVGDLLDRFLTILSATSDIPMTRLFGKSPSGLNNTGEGDLRNYYDSINSRQEFELRSSLEYIDKIMAANLGLDPQNLDFIFRPLWQLSDTEQSQVLESRARAYQILLDSGVMTESQVARELKDKHLIQSIDDESISRLEEIEADILKSAFGESDDDSAE